LLAATLKLLDGFLFFRLGESWVFTVSLLLDAVVGVAFLMAPCARGSVVSGATLFLVYTGYRLTHWSVQCDCFGSYSYWINDWILLAFVAMGFCVCVFQVFFSLVVSSFGMDKFLSILGTSAGFLLAIAFWRQTNEGELLTATASALKTTDRPGVFEGMLSIQNTTEVPLRIIGSHNTVCSGSLGISTPVAIAENSKMDVLATLPGIKQGELDAMQLVRVVRLLPRRRVIAEQCHRLDKVHRSLLTATRFSLYVCTF
jgi:hypothetical protein